MKEALTTPGTTSKAAVSIVMAWHYRLRGAVVAAPCWITLAIAAILTPRSEGYGTHEELGLPPCAFLLRHRWPCPSCGLTTSVTATIHGQFLAALHAHAFGPPLTASLVAFGTAGSLELFTGSNVLRRLRPGLWLWCVWVPVAGVLLGWAINIAAGFASGRWPLV